MIKTESSLNSGGYKKAKKRIREKEHNRENERRGVLSSSDTKFLQDELDILKMRTRFGEEVEVIWLPGLVKYQNGKKLAEEVRSDTIFIYAEDPNEASELLRHGFGEVILNKLTRPYRQMINKLIELIEDLQYERKEIIVNVLVGLMESE